MTLKTELKLFNLKIIILFFILFFLLPAFIFIPVVNVKAQTVTNISVQTAYNMINNKINILT